MPCCGNIIGVCITAACAAVFCKALVNAGRLNCFDCLIIMTERLSFGVLITVAAYAALVKRVPLFGAGRLYNGIDISVPGGRNSFNFGLAANSAYLSRFPSSVQVGAFRSYQ